jgi:hypothetical protein
MRVDNYSDLSLYLVPLQGRAVGLTRGVELPSRLVNDSAGVIVVMTYAYTYG